MQIKLSEASSTQSTSQREQKPLICYNCNETGHKSAQCPLKRKEKVKKIQVAQNIIETLGDSDVMACINGSLVPITLDSGATASIVPKEFVREDNYTGRIVQFRGVMANSEWIDAAEAIVNIKCGPVELNETVLAVPGAYLEWQGILKWSLTDNERMAVISRILVWKSSLPKEQNQYILPSLTEVYRKGAVLVSDGVEIVPESIQDCVSDVSVTEVNEAMPVGDNVGATDTHLCEFDTQVVEQPVVDGMQPQDNCVGDNNSNEGKAEVDGSKVEEKVLGSGL